ncbi:cytoplasmic protein [Neobacillus sp. YX16]|uniref:cytoplasmic protein n=1 Tax=Neobacillus sp. YX16 TaxID=3047874 RepID=UPI0024C25900|nr:cytoplasmic protein [Neobacillus sp. YX16]WHZ02866.1 cytoplasmic protein [Neobacillus sp. YX16]
MENQFREAQQFTSRHRKDLERDQVCGCFHCLKIFSPAEITEWVDDDDTALCPYCWIDSVIGVSSGFPITDKFLKEMHKMWF